LRTPTTSASAWSCLSLVVLLAGCPGNGETADPIFPDGWTGWTEVRDCRKSPEHDLVYIRILADPTAAATYLDRGGPFPEGSTVLKAEYADAACEDLEGFTAMRKGPPGSAPASGDWTWQRTDPERRVLEDGALEGCIACHAHCGVPPDGHDWTCAVP
jgi:hypothetical protein